MSKVLRKIFEFVFSEKPFLIAVGGVWIISALEIFFKFNPAVLHSAQKWMIFVFGCGVLLGLLIRLSKSDTPGGGIGGRFTGEA